MYSIYGDGVCIHNDFALSENLKVLSPKLTLTDNAAGSLELTVPPGNPGYEILQRISSEIIVYRDDEEIWSGRIITEQGDFWNRRVLTCEGELAYLNDTHQEPCEYTDITTDDFLDAVLEAHNAKVDESKQFVKGAVTIHETMYAVTNYETTIDSINTNLVEQFGGHIRIRKENGVRYVDYLAEYVNTNTQVIQFGKNLIDFVKNWDMTSFATVILPRGAQLEDSEIEGIEAYTTVKDVNAGSIYVTSEDAIKERGWIEAVIDWEDVTDPEELLEKATTYLTDTQFEEMIIEVSAVDLHYTEKEIEAIDLLDQIRCVSIPHGLDKHFPISQISIPLDNPQNAKYTLGSTVKTTLTSSNKQTNSEIMKKIENLPSKETILKKASENATHLINMATNGFITITKNQNGTEELIISDDADYTKATRLWKWNINGLGYSKDGGKTFPLAMTMDGAIVADFITTGTMSANRIRTGILESSEEYDSWSSTKYYYSGNKILYNNKYWKAVRYTYPGIKPGVTYWVETTDTTGATDFSYSTTYSAGSIVIYDSKYWKAQTSTKYAYPGRTYWAESNKNVIFDLNEGSLKISSGQIMLGEMDANGDYSFQVDDNGYLHATYGKIGGFNITEYSIYNNSLTLNSGGLRFSLDSDELGHFGTQYWEASPSDKGVTMSIEEDVSYMGWGHYDSNEGFYSMKILYTSTELEWGDGFVGPDVIVFGAPIDLSNSFPFEYTRGRRTYQSITLVDSDTEAPKLVRLQSPEGTYWDVYVVGGMIMDY